MFDFIDELSLAMQDVLLAIGSFTDYMAYQIEIISANLEFMAGILKYAPYIIITLGIVIFIQFFMIGSMKLQLGRIEKKLDEISKAPEIEKESKNGEDAQ